MEKIYELIESITPENFNAEQYLQFMLVLVVGVILIGLLGHFIFGKRSTLNHAVSSAIAILCIYVVNVVVYSTGVKLDIILSPLPFVSIQGD